MADLLYVDTSALLDRVLGQKSHRRIASALRSHSASGGRLVASRLLHLEVRRVLIREALEGRPISSLEKLANQVIALPLSDEVWAAAHAIESHAATLDSLHLATCQLVGATLLASDEQMLRAARSLGLPIHPASEDF